MTVASQSRYSACTINVSLLTRLCNAGNAAFGKISCVERVAIQRFPPFAPYDAGLANTISPAAKML